LLQATINTIGEKIVDELVKLKPGRTAEVNLG